MQYGFMPGKGTVDAAFALRRFTEKFRAKNNKLFLIFVDLKKVGEKAREVISFALTRKGVAEYLVNGPMLLYKGCKTAVSVDSKLSSSSSVKVGVHQMSALSPLLFMMVMDVLMMRRRDGWFIYCLVVCRRFCFVWRIIK